MITLYDHLEAGGLYTVDLSPGEDVHKGRPLTDVYYPNGETSTKPKCEALGIETHDGRALAVFIDVNKAMHVFKQGDTILSLFGECFTTYHKQKYEGFTYSAPEYELAYPANGVVVLYNEQIMLIRNECAGWFKKVG